MDDSLKGEFILNAKKLKKGSKLHFFSSFCSNPEGITFAEQENGEEIVLLVRRHFATNIPWLVAAMFLALFPLFFPFFINNFPFFLPSDLTIMLMLAFYYIVLFGFILLRFTLWYFHTGLVTTLRVVDIDLSGILYRRIVETKHGNIEDVTYNQTGFIASLFNYGNVITQTAGQSENIEFDRVPRPSKVADIIGDLAQPI